MWEGLWSMGLLKDGCGQSREPWPDAGPLSTLSSFLNYFNSYGTILRYSQSRRKTVFLHRPNDKRWQNSSMILITLWSCSTVSRKVDAIRSSKVSVSMRNKLRQRSIALDGKESQLVQKQGA